MTVVSVRLCFDIETLFYDLQVMCTIFVRTRERENKTKGLYQTNNKFISSCTDASIDVLSRRSKTMSGVMVGKKENSEDR